MTHRLHRGLVEACSSARACVPAAQVAADGGNELDQVLERACAVGLLSESEYDRLTDALAIGACSEAELLAEWSAKLRLRESDRAAEKAAATFAGALAEKPASPIFTPGGMAPPPPPIPGGAPPPRPPPPPPPPPPRPPPPPPSAVKMRGRGGMSPELDSEEMEHVRRVSLRQMMECVARAKENRPKEGYSPATLVSTVANQVTWPDGERWLGHQDISYLDKIWHGNGLLRLDVGPPATHSGLLPSPAQAAQALADNCAGTVLATVKVAGWRGAWAHNLVTQIATNNSQCSELFLHALKGGPACDCEIAFTVELVYALGFDDVTSGTHDDARGLTEWKWSRQREGLQVPYTVTLIVHDDPAHVDMPTLVSTFYPQQNRAVAPNLMRAAVISSPVSSLEGTRADAEINAALGPAFAYVRKQASKDWFEPSAMKSVVQPEAAVEGELEVEHTDSQVLVATTTRIRAAAVPYADEATLLSTVANQITFDSGKSWLGKQDATFLNRIYAHMLQPGTFQDEDGADVTHMLGGIPLQDHEGAEPTPVEVARTMAANFMTTVLATVKVLQGLAYMHMHVHIDNQPQGMHAHVDAHARHMHMHMHMHMCMCMYMYYICICVCICICYMFCVCVCACACACAPEGQWLASRLGKQRRVAGAQLVCVVWQPPLARGQGWARVRLRGKK